MTPLLPLDLLASFCAIADGGSFARAAEQVGRSQAAVSLQVARLEDLLGQALFRRDGRRMVLTEAGQTLLGHARRLLALNAEAVRAVAGLPALAPLRLGLVQDFAEKPLTQALGALRQEMPGLRLSVSVGRSRDLLQELDRGVLDLVLAAQPDDRLAQRLLPPEPMLWIGTPGFALDTPLPLVLLEAPCGFRDAALAALAQAGLAWEIVYESPSLTGLKAALKAGLGVTCRTARFLEPGLAPVRPLPALPVMQYGLQARPGLPEADRLAHLLTAAASP